jgi:ADP-ribose pyrophosphatase
MILESEPLYEGYNQLDLLTIKTESGKIIKRELLNNKDGVCAIIYNTVNDTYLFVEQWRPCINDKMIEVVAGSVEENETTEHSIRKEVLEETGYLCDTITYLKDFYVSPGTIKEKVNLFYVKVSERVCECTGNSLEDEELSLLELKYDELGDYEFIDAKTIIALDWLKRIEEN